MTTEIPEEVIRRFAYKRELPLRDARSLFGDLVSFLDAAVSRRLTPTRPVDDAWHEFILHTKDYTEFCTSRYGRAIHHIPTSPISCETETEDEADCGTGSIDTLVTGSTVADCTSNCASDCRSD